MNNGQLTMIKVLFVCIHNSARSQMAEAFANLYGKGEIIAKSAGLEKGKLNPFVVEVMHDINIDISKNDTNTVEEFISDGKKFDYLITVCDETNGERCPIYPGLVKDRIHWTFEDPSSFEGTDKEKLQFTRKVRNQIKVKIEEFVLTTS
ncbi:MAG: arsenate reductase ArsC [Candidatus Delongbacteria bacterium]|nr:arsenate reductase ArsC [Candidatus Delongbacteria bacterium]